MRRRLVLLDVLRTVAILLVLGRHMPPGASNIVTRAWQRGGWIGVDLFFVLSGFLVSGLLFSEHNRRGHVDLRRFIVRRWLRILPAFYLLIAATVLWDVAHHQLRVVRVLHEIFFIQNYAYGLWPHTWSLAVEEHFYILLPLAWLVLTRVRPRDPLRPIVPIAITTAVVLLFARVGTYYLAPFDPPHRQLFATHLRLDALLLGVALARVYHRDPARVVRVGRRYAWLLAGVAVAVCLPPFLVDVDTTPWLYTGWLTMLSIGSLAALVLAVAFEDSRHRVVTKWGASLGARSYSIYLWHNAVGVWGLAAIAHVVDLPWAGKLAVYVAGSLVVGVLMAEIVEIPVLRVRDRFFPSLSRATVRQADGFAGDNPLG